MADVSADRMYPFPPKLLNSHINSMKGQSTLEEKSENVARL
jgi:hypothetical protein